MWVPGVLQSIQGCSVILSNATYVGRGVSRPASVFLSAINDSSLSANRLTDTRSIGTTSLIQDAPEFSVTRRLDQTSPRPSMEIMSSKEGGAEKEKETAQNVSAMDVLATLLDGRVVTE